MRKKLFISYSHRQSDWVVSDLKPVLTASGADVLIDADRFRSGKGVKGQMDGLQDQADLSLLVLTSDYLASDYCMHELRRAVAKDPDFTQGSTIPVFREASATPAELLGADPVLYINLQDTRNEQAWDRLLKSCGADQL